MMIDFKKLSLFLIAAFLMSSVAVFAQNPTPSGKTESSEAIPFDTVPPLDDIVERNLTNDSRVLPYQPIREADIFWEKKIWRIIDTREKMNLPFGYPEEPLFTVILSGVEDGSIRAFVDDSFKQPLRPSEVAAKLASTDTIVTFDPETYEEKIEVVRNDMDAEDVKRYRVKERWFFDEETSTLQVRILGIAPYRDIVDKTTGEFKYEQALFWIYYPECREKLARHNVYNEGNDASPYTWEDLFEMRFFSSYIYKENDVKGRRLEDYLSGLDLLLDADKIRQDIFNWEHDLWSY